MKSLKKLILIPAFHGMDNFSGNLLADRIKYAQPLEGQSFLKTGRSQISKLHRIKSTLRRWMHLFKLVYHNKSAKKPIETSTIGNKDPFSKKEFHLTGHARVTMGWVPLIKACNQIRHEINPTQNQHSGAKQVNLTGQAVLCVGGRAALYPDYLRLVESAGGCLMIYRASPVNSTVHLHNLLQHANMVICPVDCISHDDYFAVRRYCKLTGKACAFLARSSLPNFSRGLAMLVNQFQENNLLKQ